MMREPAEVLESEAHKVDSPAPPRWEYATAIGIFVLASIAAIGLRVPSGNEWAYLVRLRHFADPSYLASDWTFGSGFAEHFVWVRVFAPVARLFGVEALAVAGRLLLWVAISLLFIEIGQRLGARPLLTTIALIAWLGLDQSMGVGASRIITEFQASVVAYPLLLGAMVLALRGRISWSMAAAGVAFSIHPGVGLWGSGALALTLLLLPETRARALRSVWLLILGALPGAVPQVLSLVRSTISPSDAAFVALVRIPHHVDPFTFGERGPILLSVMLLFNLLLHWQLRQQSPHRLLGMFQAISLLPVGLAVIARFADQFWFLTLLPFRVLPAFATAVFLINLAALAGQRRWTLLLPQSATTGTDRVRSLAGLGAVAGMLVLWNPIIGLAQAAPNNFDLRRPALSDVELALDWVALETPTNAQVLGPPDREDLFFRTERAQYVSWEAVVYDRVPEWRRRLESVMPVGFFDDYRRNNSWVDEFAMLSKDRLQNLSPGVDYVITTATYDLPAVYRSGDWIVYEVSGP